MIARYVPGKLVIYTRNRHFRVWSQEARPDGIPDTIRWRIDVPRSGGNEHRLNKQLRLVERGEADIAYNTMTARDAVLVQLQHPSQVRLTTFPGGGVWGYWLNTQRGLFTSLVARETRSLRSRSEFVSRDGGTLPARTIPNQSGQSAENLLF